MERSRSILRGIWVCVVAGALVLHGAGSARADVFHVKADAAGAGDGSSWPDAFTDLQFALDVAAAGDEIRVAAGIYRPSERTDPADPRSATFQLRSGVALHGGFAGTETSLTERAGLFEQTILTGDLNADDVPITNPADLPDEPTRAENAYHVVTGSGTDETAILDGFTITAGQADGEFPHNGGGGMLNDFANPTVTNCTFRVNAALIGGGVLTNQGTPRFKRCSFEGNFAENVGGGMHNQATDAVVDDCTFTNNAAGSGGALAIVDGSEPTLTACSFRRNAASFDGGAILNATGSSPTLVDCMLEENIAARFGGGIDSEGANSVLLERCTLRGNRAQFGGGLFHLLGRLSLIECVLEENVAAEGGGLYKDGGQVVLADCTIRDNAADGLGGGVFLFALEAMVKRCTFLANRGGSGLYADTADTFLLNSCFLAHEGRGAGFAAGAPSVVGCTFIGNSKGVGSSNRALTALFNCTIAHNVEGILNGQSAHTSLTNCTVWGNIGRSIRNEGVMGDVTYSCVQGGWPGIGNIDVDPRFVRSPSGGNDGFGDDRFTPDLDEGANDDFGDLRLRAGSPCIDAGRNDVDLEPFITEGIQRLPATDRAGNPRFLDDPATADTGSGTAPIVDMGAFEFVLPGDSDFDYDVDLADYLVLVQCMSGPGAPFEQGCHPADLDRDGDVDLADLIQLQAIFTGPR